MHSRNRFQTSTLDQALHRTREIGEQGLSDLGLKQDPSGKGAVIGIIRSSRSVAELLGVTSSGRGLPETFSEKPIGPLLKMEHVSSRGSRRII